MTEPLKAKITEFVSDLLTLDSWDPTPEEAADHILKLVAEHQPARSEVKAQELEVDGEAGAWYVRILDEQVHHTTEGAPVNIDWTADGTMVGVEVLGSVEKPSPRVFFPGDMVPKGVRIVDRGGWIHGDRGIAWQLHSVPGGAAVEVFEPARSEWQAVVARARAEREAKQ